MASNEISEISSPWPMSDDLEEPSPPLQWRTSWPPQRRLHGINQQDPFRMLRPRRKLSKKSQVRSETTACGTWQHHGEVRHPVGPRGESRNEIAFMFPFFSGYSEIWQASSKVSLPFPCNSYKEPQETCCSLQTQADPISSPRLPLHEEGASELAVSS